MLFFPAFGMTCCKSAFRVSLSGNGMYNRVGKRRKTAESMSQGQFVHAINSKCFPSSFDPFTIPSTWVMNSVLNRLDASCSPSLLRLDNKASISSTKIILGAAARATSNNVFSSFSPSPCHLLVKELSVQIKRRHSLSLATAFTSNVLPVPGGPYSNMFLGFLKPVKRSGRAKGRIATNQHIERPSCKFKVDVQ